MPLNALEKNAESCLEYFYGPDRNVRTRVLLLETRSDGHARDVLAELDADGLAPTILVKPNQRRDLEKLRKEMLNLPLGTYIMLSVRLDPAFLQLERPIGMWHCFNQGGPAIVRNVDAVIEYYQQRVGNKPKKRHGSAPGSATTSAPISAGTPSAPSGSPMHFPGIKFVPKLAERQPRVNAKRSLAEAMRDQNGGPPHKAAHTSPGSGSSANGSPAPAHASPTELATFPDLGDISVLPEPGTTTVAGTSTLAGTTTTLAETAALAAQKATAEISRTLRDQLALLSAEITQIHADHREEMAKLAVRHETEMFELQGKLTRHEVEIGLLKGRVIRMNEAISELEEIRNERRERRERREKRKRRERDVEVERTAEPEVDLDLNDPEAIDYELREQGFREMELRDMELGLGEREFTEQDLGIEESIDSDIL